MQNRGVLLLVLLCFGMGVLMGSTEEQSRLLLPAAPDGARATLPPADRPHYYRGEGMQAPLAAARVALAAPSFSGVANNRSGPKLAIVCTTNQRPADILEWIAYHQKVGVREFFMYSEHRPETFLLFKKAMAAIPGVVVISDAELNRRPSAQLGGKSLCGTANEGSDLVLECAPGSGVMSGVEFASFGTPSIPGDGCAGVAQSACHGPVGAFVRAKCLRRTKCVIPATTAALGDPCAGTRKQLHVRVAGCRAAPKVDWDSGAGCNGELFLRQRAHLKDAVQLARRRNVDWIMHVDTDELLYPGQGQEFNMAKQLGALGADIGTVVFPNWEAATESDGIRDSFREVTLFKRNFDHVDTKAYFAAYGELNWAKNPNYFLAYGNGKSAARVNAQLEEQGAHRFSNGLAEMTSPHAAVLHYVYTQFHSVQSRGARGTACGCKPTAEDAKRCFLLPFDQIVFLKSELMGEGELRNWFKTHVMWQDAKLVQKYVKGGLLARVHEVQLVLDKLEREA